MAVSRLNCMYFRADIMVSSSSRRLPRYLKLRWRIFHGCFGRLLRAPQRPSPPQALIWSTTPPPRHSLLGERAQSLFAILRSPHLDEAGIGILTRDCICHGGLLEAAADHILGCPNGHRAVGKDCIRPATRGGHQGAGGNDFVYKAEPLSLYCAHFSAGEYHAHRF